MYNIFKNTWMIFVRNKEYISTIVVAPVIMLLVFSFILSFQSKVNIAIIDQDHSEIGSMVEHTLDNTDLFHTISMDLDEVNQSIINNKIEFAVVIKNNTESIDLTKDKLIEIIKAKDSKLADYMETILNNNINAKLANRVHDFEILKNEVPKKGVPINNALGMVIFKMIGSCSLLAGLIIAEKRNGILNRIYMSKTKMSAYLFGRGSVFFINLVLFIFVYFITSKIFQFDFAMKNPFNLIVVFSVLAIFTIAFGLVLSAFTNDENHVWNFSVLVLLPSSILSGALFPYDAMPKIMQTIGALFPQRWIISAIETLQNGGSLVDTMVPLTRVLILSVLLFIIAANRINRLNIT
ncbi:ABC transporter permease [Tissierella sp. MB52-C2]|uniref:ABC transporter permease n=1 Tax=Tissierella sp. MB52-C2 TaxID=3070999 RepID=UPI00280B01EB|nr:ABC transporter permease [Tissierella sp. MB52-C2]WMM26322.1 ABC transporter permease [Tissierella sp. MB52-C2]